MICRIPSDVFDRRQNVRLQLTTRRTATHAAPKATPPIRIRGHVFRSTSETGMSCRNNPRVINSIQRIGSACPMTATIDGIFSTGAA